MRSGGPPAPGAVLRAVWGREGCCLGRGLPPAVRGRDPPGQGGGGVPVQ